ncbi:MAG: DnaJ domain-containing protein [Candidatus Limnocylindrales bacterium]
MTRTYYDVLFVSPRADRELIGVVYRHLAKRYHPDRDASPEAAVRMTELNEAWSTLGDPAKRAQYDISVGLRSAQSAVAPVAGDGRPARAGGANTAQDTGPYGEAGPPPANPAAKGRPLTFGRYRGWTLNQVDRYDRGYVEWLSRATMGRNYKAELDELLGRVP